MYPEFASALLEETGIDIQLDRTGTLYLAFTEHDVDELEQRYEWQTTAGLPVEKLSVDTARKLEPAIRDELRGALRFPLDTQVENRRLLSALAVSNERLGVQMETGTDVVALKVERSRITGVETSFGFVATDRVVIAGFSLGGDVALRMAMNQVLPVRGFIAFAPGGPCVSQPEKLQALFEARKGKGMRGYVMMGEADPSYEWTQRLIQALKDFSVPHQVEFYPGLGHAYPPNFADSLLRALDFILQR